MGDGGKEKKTKGTHARTQRGTSPAGQAPFSSRAGAGPSLSWKNKTAFHRCKGRQQRAASSAVFTDEQQPARSIFTKGGTQASPLWPLPHLDSLDTSSELRMPPSGDSRGDSAFSNCSGSMGAIADLALETRIFVYQLVSRNIVCLLFLFYGIFMSTRSV